MSAVFPQPFDCILTKIDYKRYNVPKKQNKVGNNCSKTADFNGKIGLSLYVENFFTLFDKAWNSVYNIKRNKWSPYGLKSAEFYFAKNI